MLYSVIVPLDPIRHSASSFCAGGPLEASLTAERRCVGREHEPADTRRQTGRRHDHRLTPHARHASQAAPTPTMCQYVNVSKDVTFAL